MLEPWVPSLIWEDPTCCETAKPVQHHSWGQVPEPASHNYQARRPQLLTPTLRNKRRHHSEESVHYSQRAAPAPHSQRKPSQQPRPSTARNQYNKKQKQKAADSLTPTHLQSPLRLHILLTVSVLANGTPACSLHLHPCGWCNNSSSYKFNPESIVFSVAAEDQN